VEEDEGLLVGEGQGGDDERFWEGRGRVRWRGRHVGFWCFLSVWFGLVMFYLFYRWFCGWCCSVVS